MARVPQDTGEERLIGEAEVLGGLRAAGAEIVLSTQLGMVPDFVPRAALRAAAAVERAVERTPLVRRLGAHNVVLATKPADRQRRSRSRSQARGPRRGAAQRRDLGLGGGEPLPQLVELASQVALVALERALVHRDDPRVVVALDRARRARPLPDARAPGGGRSIGAALVRRQRTQVQSTSSIGSAIAVAGAELVDGAAALLERAVVVDDHVAARRTGRGRATAAPSRSPRSCRRRAARPTSARPASPGSVSSKNPGRKRTPRS